MSTQSRTVGPEPLRGRCLPLIMQREASECGLACLSMIAWYHGRRMSLMALRGTTPPPSNGMSLERVIEKAAGLGLDSRALWVEPREIAWLDTPCILHWDRHHFVVLRSASAQQIIIHDPLRGVRQLGRAHVARHFSRAALELWPARGFSGQSAIGRLLNTPPES